MILRVPRNVPVDWERCREALAVAGGVWLSCAAAPSPATGAPRMLCALRLVNGSGNTLNRYGLALHGPGHTHTRQSRAGLGSAIGCIFGSLGEGAGCWWLPGLCWCEV